MLILLTNTSQPHIRITLSWLITLVSSVLFCPTASCVQGIFHYVWILNNASSSPFVLGSVAENKWNPSTRVRCGLHNVYTNARGGRVVTTKRAYSTYCLNDDRIGRPAFRDDILRYCCTSQNASDIIITPKDRTAAVVRSNDNVSSNTD